MYGIAFMMEDLEKAWRINCRCISMVKDCKSTLEKAALQSWPQLPSYKEDISLRNRTKWAKYDGKRPIMWDMTNVPAYMFTDGATQRGTFSDYYGMNCLKAGNFLMLCGWH